jgi:hypothetical protein
MNSELRFHMLYLPVWFCSVKHSFSNKFCVEGNQSYIFLNCCPCCCHRELLTEVIQLLRNTANSQVEQIIRVMKRWAKDNRINV